MLVTKAGKSCHRTGKGCLQEKVQGREYTKTCKPKWVVGRRYTGVRSGMLTDMKEKGHLQNQLGTTDQGTDHVISSPEELRIQSFPETTVLPGNLEVQLSTATVQGMTASISIKNMVF